MIQRMWGSELLPLPRALAPESIGHTQGFRVMVQLSS